MTITAYSIIQDITQNRTFLEFIKDIKEFNKSFIHNV